MPNWLTGLHNYARFNILTFSTARRYASALEVFLNDMRYINPRFTYLLTYMLWPCVRLCLSVSVFVCHKSEFH